MKKYLDPITLANDQNLFYSHKDVKKLFEFVNGEQKLVSDWLLANKILLNAKKTKYVLFHEVQMCAIFPW